MLVQKLRLQHGWSQQQLAEASGLSVRTVQRIEAGYPASTESLKSLAAVFEVDFSTLSPEQDMSATACGPSEQQEQEAFKYVRDLRRFYMHLFKYVLVTLALLAVNLFFLPQHLWALWVMGGLGTWRSRARLPCFRPQPAAGSGLGTSAGRKASSASALTPPATDRTPRDRSAGAARGSTRPGASKME